MDNLNQFLPQDAKTSLGLVITMSLLMYIVGLGVYRLFLSPLAGFPGPKIAAITGWYEFYHDILKQGTYLFRIEDMHRKYGPIVRISPEELSIHDAAFYSEVYVVGSRRRTENFHGFAQGLAFEDSHMITIDHDLHHKRRKPMEPFFSRTGVRQLSTTLNGCVRRLLDRFDQMKGTGAIIRLDHVHAAFTGDIMRKVCCESKDSFLDEPDFAAQWYNTLRLVALTFPLLSSLTFLVRIVVFVPQWILLWAFPGGNDLKAFRNLAMDHILDAKQEKERADASDKSVDTRTSVFRHIMSSDMPESERSTERLCREAQILLGGGSFTTARMLDFISFYILDRPGLRARLREELEVPMADFPARIPPFEELEKLPWLHAVIKEGPRLGYGVMHRLPRVCPDQAIQYKQWTIPPGAAVGMSAYFMHTDPGVYPNPFEFKPERWLGKHDLLMDRNLVTFTRGSRQCLGMHLATAELHTVIAAIFRPNGPELELFETDESDVRLVHDFLLPLPKLDSKGIRVRVK